MVATDTQIESALKSLTEAQVKQLSRALLAFAAQRLNGLVWLGEKNGAPLEGLQKTDLVQDGWTKALNRINEWRPDTEQLDVFLLRIGRNHIRSRVGNAVRRHENQNERLSHDEFADSLSESPEACVVRSLFVADLIKSLTDQTEQRIVRTWLEFAKTGRELTDRQLAVVLGIELKDVVNAKRRLRNRRNMKAMFTKEISNVQG